MKETNKNNVGSKYMQIWKCQGSIFEGQIYLRSIYRNNPKYWDRKAFVNSVDPDQTPQNAASDQGLHCLPYIIHTAMF